MIKRTSARLRGQHPSTSSSIQTEISTITSQEQVGQVGGPSPDSSPQNIPAQLSNEAPPNHIPSPQKVQHANHIPSPQKIQHAQILSHDSVIALQPVVTIFLKTMLYLNPINQTATRKKTKLARLERISWHTLIEISQSFIDGHQETIEHNLVLKHNLAHFLVKLIETPEKLIHEDLSLLVRSCLINVSSRQNHLNQNKRTIEFIVNLEAFKWASYSTQKPSTTINPSQFLFDPEAGQVQKNLAGYCTDVGLGPLVSDHDSDLFNETSNAVYQGMIACNLINLQQSLSSTMSELTNSLINLINELIPDTVSAEHSPIMVAEDYISTLETSSSLPDAPNLAQSDAGSSSSEESDEFQADILIENPSPPKSTSHLHDFNQVSQLDESLLSNDFGKELKLIPAEDGFLERHNQIVAADSSEQGIIYKQLADMVNKNPQLFVQPNTTPERGLPQMTSVLVAENSLHSNGPALSSSPIKALSKPCLTTNQSTIQLEPSPRSQNGTNEEGSKSTAAQNDSGSTHCNLPCAHEINPGAKAPDLTSDQVQSLNPTEHMPTPSTHSPIQNTTTFCFNVRQEDAVQIEFESLPGGQTLQDAQDQGSATNEDLARLAAAMVEDLVENSACQSQSPRAQGRQHPLKDKIATSSKPISKSKLKGHQKIFPSATSGFLSSSSNDLDSDTHEAPGFPPLRGKEAKKKTSTKQPTSRREQAINKSPPANHVSSCEDQLEDPNQYQVEDPNEDFLPDFNLQAASTSHQVHEQDRDNEWLESTQPRDSGFGNQMQVSTPPSPIPVSRRCAKSKVSNTSPSPLPVAKCRHQSRHSDTEDSSSEHCHRHHKKQKIMSTSQNCKRKQMLPDVEQRGRSYAQRPSGRRQAKPRGRLPERVGKVFWTEDEEKLLIREVEKYYHMKNCMAHIISRHGPDGTLTETFAHRTSLQLKDKAVNLSTKWYANKIPLSEERQRAFARFPPKIQAVVSTSDHSSSEKIE